MPHRTDPRHVLCVLLLAGLVGLPAVAPAGGRPADGPWIGPGGEPLPFDDADGIRSFLRLAEVEKIKVITSGINRPIKVLLRRDGVEAKAIFRTVDVHKNTFKTQGQVQVDFRDHYAYECAAYEMSLLLGLDSVPPCVTRKLWGRHGSLQLWVEDVMTVEMQMKRDLRSPKPLDWVRQQQSMKVFDALIRNLDRHQGNLLVDEDWKLWLIDHTRSFHALPRIAALGQLTWCERGLWTRLRALSAETVRERLGEYLSATEIRALMRRRDVIVEHFEERIATLGESAVLYSLAAAPEPVVLVAVSDPDPR